MPDLGHRHGPPTHRHLSPFFLDEINNKVLSDFCAARIEQRRTNATIQRDLTTISAVLSKAVAWDWIETNPLDLFPRDEYDESRDPIVLPKLEEIEKFIGRCPGNLSRMARFMKQSGVRLSEATSLEWWQFDHNRKTVYLPLTKTSRPRVIALSDEAAGTLAGTPPHSKTSWVSWHGDGEPYRNAISRMSYLAEQIGSDLSAC